MRLSYTSLLSLTAVASAGLGAAKRVRSADNGGADPAFSVNSTALQNALYCPQGITGKAGGVILLVHGTGSDGNSTWANTPYYATIPNKKPGFDVCWVSIPGISQQDVQVNSEYVAGNILPLAKKSATGKVHLIGHSQGNLNIQWTLDFWPKLRKRVSTFVAISPDFQGSTSFPAACQGVNTTGQGCTQAIIQQSANLYGPGRNSNFLTALAVRGLHAFVPTTTIFSRYDDLIMPETPGNATSQLRGAANFALQDPGVCGPNHPTSHFSNLLDPAGYHLALHTLRHGAGPSKGDFKRKWCRDEAGSGFLANAVAWQSALTLAAVNSLSSSFTQPVSKAEAPLKPYVCASGAATVCGA